MLGTNILSPDSSDRITANEDEGATVLAFAQKEMVAGFMEGIDPIFKTNIRKALKQLFAAYPGEVIKRLPKLTPAQEMKLTNDMQKVGDDLADLFYKAIGEHSSAKHTDPVLRAVSVLPKDELASMAEALVNLTSFKRRVTFDAETVGGPIDVAVISKGDGFIWIKRKHYFKAENNPQFFRNNYR